MGGEKRAPNSLTHKITECDLEILLLLELNLFCCYNCPWGLSFGHSTCASTVDYWVEWIPLFFIARHATRHATSDTVDEWDGQCKVWMGVWVYTGQIGSPKSER